MYVCLSQVSVQNIPAHPLRLYMYTGPRAKYPCTHPLTQNMYTGSRAKGDILTHPLTCVIHGDHSATRKIIRTQSPNTKHVTQSHAPKGKLHALVLREHGDQRGARGVRAHSATKNLLFTQVNEHVLGSVTSMLHWVPLIMSTGYIRAPGIFSLINEHF